MKNHAIIPIFIPHLGCPFNCIFCNQKKITSRANPVSKEDVRSIIESHLATIENRGIKNVEVAFYGGSFTGISMEEQTDFLTIAMEYKNNGRIDKIHISTRPDYIDERILINLKEYGVDIIELGVQSFDEDVLKLSNRGHDSTIVRQSSKLIKEYGFTLGIQLMVGLPGDTYEKDMFSAMETVKIKPSIARIYPTIILEDTELFQLSLENKYSLLSEEEAIRRSKDMYVYLYAAGINVIRIGLKNTFGAYHPSFRELVETEAAKDSIESQLNDLLENSSVNQTPCVEKNSQTPCVEKNSQIGKNIKAVLLSNRKSISFMVGNKGSNRDYFKKKFPMLLFEFQIDESLGDSKYMVKIELAV